MICSHAQGQSSGIILACIQRVRWSGLVLIVAAWQILPLLGADAAANGPGSDVEPAQKTETAAPPKPPPPRTFFQAFHQYLHKLCNPQERLSEDAKNGDKEDKAGKKEDKKAPKNKKEQKGEESPALAGEANKPADQKKGQDPESAEKQYEKEKGKDESEKKDEAASSWFSAHGQATMDAQLHGPFHADYSGPRSLSPFQEIDTSLTSTIFLDARLWERDDYSAELIFNPELSGGKGFSGVDGIAGFPNGDITRVGVIEPTPYIARLYLRQTWGFGDEQEKVEDEPNQIAGSRDIDRLTLSVGKFAFTDIIDNNAYSHDPRTQMQNWSLMYNGAWDYPSNVRGYSYGVAVDFNQKYWALRYGIMAEPAVANGAEIDPHFTKAFGQALEWEGRWTVNDHKGRIRLMTYLNRAHMGDYAEALQEMPVAPDVTLTRSYRFKYGFGLNVEQELTRDLGIWGRLGWDDGHTETWAFTPIDRTAAMGLLLKGSCWCRPDDAVGIAGVLNGLAKDHRQYLAAGGLDFSIGDGALNYGLEEIFEIYYRFAITKNVFVAPDFQAIGNPAYNRDRGPVSVESVVVHIEF